MHFSSRQNKAVRQLTAGSLVVLLLVLLLDSSGALARGRRGGGAAGALDDFDLFLLMQTTNGLPPSLISGFEPANSIAGDATVGVGGTLSLDQLQQTINSQSGDAVILLPAGIGGSSSGTGNSGSSGGNDSGSSNGSGSNDNGGRRAGMLRKLGPEALPAMMSLKSVPVPSVPELAKFIRDPKAAVLLGKAFFWDVQAGSDGNACASCHFHAGADNRMKNQLSPGLNSGDKLFQMTASGGGGPNYKLKPEDFPFHRLADPLDRNSEVLFDSNDVVSSQGAFGGVFQQNGLHGKDQCGDRPSPDSFNVNGVLTRRVAARNSPSAINAVFNFRNFWDGRANNRFNGVSPFGPRDPNARVLELLPDGGTTWTSISIRNASLASQAVGPILSEFEMSCENRNFKDVARKLLALRPLRLQEVHPHDSVLGAHIAPDRHGIKPGYSKLIQDAFDPKWWNAPGDFNGYTQMETNFSLYWGLAIMMYESTLISDETPFDKLVGDAGHPADHNALTPKQLRGLGVFRGKGQCVTCHKGAEFTGAGTSLQPSDGEGSVLESMFLKTGELGVYDNGFYNIGVRPAAEDRGVGGKDPFGNALSLTRNWFDQLRLRAVADPVWADPCLFAIFFDASACWIAPDAETTRIVADGAFKTPSLRNVALTQPYFHNGGYFTLEQVVEFYNRGSDRRGPDDDDTTGFVDTDATNGGTTNLHPSIKPLGLTQNEISDLVDFMRYALTDPRVACEQAPFDHPALRLPDGHAGDENLVRDRNHNGLADDKHEMLPAVGRNGRVQEQCFRNDDGSRAVALTDPGGQGQSPPVTSPPNVPTSGTPANGTPATGTPANGTPPNGTSVNGTPANGTPANGTLANGTLANGTLATGGISSGAFRPRSNTSTSRSATVASTAAIVTSGSFSPDKSAKNGSDESTFGTSSNFGSSFRLEDRSNESRASGVDRNSSNERKESGTERTSELSNSQAPEPARTAPSQLPPVANINAPAEVMASSRVTLYGSVTTGATFSWAQTSGPSVPLAGDSTLAPSFTAPATPATLVFELTATNADGVSASVNRVIKTIPDSVKVSQVAWSKQQGKGKVSVVAASSAITTNNPTPPVGMTMTATFWSKDIPVGLSGSSTKPIMAPMMLVKDMPGQPPLCASKLPCFSATLVDGIIDPRSPPASPQFLPPTTVIIKSSLGGSNTVQGKNIQIKQADDNNRRQDAVVMSASGVGAKKK